MSEKITIERVRLGMFPKLLTKGSMSGKYEAGFFLDKNKHAKEIANLNKQVLHGLTEAKLNIANIERKNLCFLDADLLDKKYVENAFILKCKSNQPIDLRDANLNKITSIDRANEIFVAGCFVNICISLYVYNKILKGITANLHGVQYAGIGERLTPDYNDCSNVFTPITIEEIEDLENEF